VKALIAMSGGVDSSVAAYLAQREGYECIGCTMKLYTNTDAGISERHTCCSLDDVEDARAVAYRLGMRYCVFNFSEGFREQVMLPFCEAYRRARTPNPCIECNRRMKFDALFRRAEELGCEKIVTGHYARIARAGERYILQKALDETKDQSYVLYAMTQRELAHTLFPLGAMRKSDRRDAGLRQRAQKGQPGHLLCPGRRLCRHHRALDGGEERSRRIRLDGRARSRRA